MPSFSEAMKDLTEYSFFPSRRFFNSDLMIVGLNGSLTPSGMEAALLLFHRKKILLFVLELPKKEERDCLRQLFVNLLFALPTYNAGALLFTCCSFVNFAYLSVS